MKRSAEDEALKAAFIAKKGVTKCDAFMPLPVPEPVVKKPVSQPVKERVYTPIDLDPGPEPQMLYVDIDELHVNPEYQRAVSTGSGQRVIREIVERFKWRYFTPLTITPRAEGGYWLIDGQHRTLAAKMRGFKKVPAILLDDMTPQEQAAAFTGINKTRTAVNIFSLHHALKAAGDEMELRIKAVVDKAGVVIPRYPKAANRDLQANETLALGTIRMAIKKYGDQAVVEVLQGIRQAYPTTPGKITKDALIAKLEKWHLRRLYKED